MPETIWGVADYYELLSVSRTATSEEIRAAITGQRRIWVRRQSSPDLERRAEAEQRVRDIDAAERTLLNAERRREYDQQFQPSEAPPAPAEPAWPPPEKPGPKVIWDRPDAEDYHLDMGDKYLDQGKWDRAIAEFAYVLERSPHNVDAAQGLAAVHSASGRIEADLRPLEQAVAANPKDSEAKRLLVTALFDSAIAVLSYGPRIGSRRQWRIVGDRLRRIKRLRMRDPRTKVLVGQLKELRQRVRRGRWEMVMSPGIYVGLIIAAWLPAVLMGFSRPGYLYTAILLGCLLVVFVLRHRRFGIQRVARRPPLVSSAPRSSTADDDILLYYHYNDPPHRKRGWWG